MPRRFEFKQVIRVQPKRLIRVETKRTTKLTLKQRLAELKEVLRYNKATGLFHWKIYTTARGQMISPGDVAGGVNSEGYVIIFYTHADGVKRRYRAHRLAWWFIKGGNIPREVDHKNRKRSDNCWTNLRKAKNRTYTNINAETRSDNCSGYAGVSWRKDTQKWHARITKYGKTTLLGDFDTLKKAIAVRKKAEHDLFGGFKYNKE